MKAYLDANISGANLTKDDGAALAKYIVCYGTPNYPMTRVFIDRKVDVVYSIGEPVSTPMFDPLTEAPYAYEEHVPITIYTIDKKGVTGTKMKWTAEAELRSVVENNPTGSLLGLDRRDSRDDDLGSTILYSTTYVLNYRRLTSS